jgi:hypothetical protein
MSGENGRSEAMDAKAAIRKAKDWIADVYAEEDIRNVGLEEVRRNGDQWLITIGFSRPWDDAGSLITSIAGEIARRTYKTVRIDDASGDVLASEIREPAR